MNSYAQVSAAPLPFPPAAGRPQWFSAWCGAMMARIGRLFSQPQDMVWDPETETLKPVAAASYLSILSMHPAIVSSTIFDR